jgi:hypothetical protein
VADVVASWAVARLGTKHIAINMAANTKFFFIASLF